MITDNADVQLNTTGM